MRVLICSDRMGPLSSAQAGRALASGWPGAQVRTAGEAGAGFVEATADGWEAPLQRAVLDGLPVESAVSAAGAAVVGVSRLRAPAGDNSPIPYHASSAVLGRAVASILREYRPRRLLVDLAGLDVHDGGAGLLAELGAHGEGGDLDAGVAGLGGLDAVNLDEVRRSLAGVELVGVVPTAQRDDLLLGLRGITSRRGRAAGEDVAGLLATDSALEQFTGLVAAELTSVPGAGAAGGLGWAVLALGGTLATGPELALAAVQAGLDLVVTGCSLFDFASRGGGVVAMAAALAADRLCPCIVIAGEVLIGGREMRTMGVESAYAIRESRADIATGAGLTETELARIVTRVSRSWRW
ncbi:MAG: glycerate kinase [Microlunatus sp.]|nr:glycerate kinase [Microlunatus sp.]